MADVLKIEGTERKRLTILGDGLWFVIEGAEGRDGYEEQARNGEGIDRYAEPCSSS